MRKWYVVAAVAAVLAVSSCGWTKKSLGLAKTGPDETLVQTNKPLILPPEYDARPNKILVKSQDEEADTADEVSVNENE